MQKEPIPCADVVARTASGLIVVIKRKTAPCGYAVPGGKQELGESLSQTATREFFEETGMVLTTTCIPGIYADVKRDPRGHYASTSFAGVAHGTPKDEVGKTEVLLLTEEEVHDLKDEFVNDHYQIIVDALPHI